MSITAKPTTVLSETLREMYAQMHGWLEGTFGTVTTDQAHWQPSGRAEPAAANYVHHLVFEDAAVSLARGTTPLFAGDWQDRTGISEPFPGEGQWDGWARRLQVDLEALHHYAAAVFIQTDAYLTTVTPEEWTRPLDMTPFGLGQQTVGWMLTTGLINGAAHCGEISAIKGLQGLQGYPF